MQTEQAEAFSAFATFLGTPLPDDPTRALRILRAEVKREVARLIEFLDATDGDPDLEDGADDEPGTDEEASLGWTGTTNQTSRNRLGPLDGFSIDCEKDDADSEDSDPGEDNGDLEPSLGGAQLTSADGSDCDLERDDCDDEDGHDHEQAVGPSPKLAAHLRAYREPSAPHCNVTLPGGTPFILRRPW